jgi:hypothetical protein
MRKALIVLMGATFLAPSCAQAITLAAPIGLQAAIHEKGANAIQEVACRRGRCRETSGIYRASPYQTQGYVYQRGNEEYFRLHGGWQYQYGPYWGQPLGGR